MLSADQGEGGRDRPVGGPAADGAAAHTEQAGQLTAGQRRSSATGCHRRSSPGRVQPFSTSIYLDVLEVSLWPRWPRSSNFGHIPEVATPRRLRWSTACASDPTPIGVTTRAAMSPPSCSSTSVEHRVIRPGLIPVHASGCETGREPVAVARQRSPTADSLLGELSRVRMETRPQVVAVRRTRDVRVTARPRLFHRTLPSYPGRRRTAYCSIASRARTGRRDNTAGASPRWKRSCGRYGGATSDRADEGRPCAGVVISWTGARQLARGSSREDQQLVGGEPR